MLYLKRWMHKHAWEEKINMKHRGTDRCETESWKNVPENSNWKEKYQRKEKKGTDTRPKTRWLNINVEHECINNLSFTGISIFSKSFFNYTPIECRSFSQKGKHFRQTCVKPNSQQWLDEFVLTSLQLSSNRVLAQIINRGDEFLIVVI